MENYDIETLKNMINELEDKSTPLIKTKGKKQQLEERSRFSKNENLKPTSEEKNVIFSSNEQQQEEVKTKEKKRWSDKKAEQFKLMQEKRKEQVDKINKNKKLESAKLLLSEALTNKTKKQQLPKQDKELYKVESESEPEEEIIYVKKDKPKKKKVKKIIIHQSSSESESESEEEEIKLKTNREFKSARNKKSIVKVHENNNNKQPVNTFNPNNFFV